MDLAQALNIPVSVSFGGREFNVRQLKAKEWASLQAWLKTAIPSPITLALKAAQEARDMGVTIDPAIERTMFAQAQTEARAWPPAVASAAWFEAIDGIEDGWRKVTGYVLDVCGATFANGEFDRAIDAATVGEVTGLMRMATYGDPPSAPKAPPATMTTSEPESLATTGE